MIKPKILKSENICLWYTCTNLNLARQMIRSYLGQGKDQSERILTSPGHRGEEPVHLFKEGRILHITPGVTSSFYGQFNEAQVTDDIIKDEAIIEIPPGLFLFSLLL